jgi:hypothetical protein
MLWLLRFLTPLIGKIASGPLLEIIDKLVADADLKERLKAEIRSKLIEHDRALVSARRDVVIAEGASESWLTRSWRPLLMYLLMSFLLFFGLLLPLMELALGRPLPTSSYLDRIPEPAWNLLTLGLCGYVGGRTVEKIALGLFSGGSRSRRQLETTRPRRAFRRRK